MKVYQHDDGTIEFECVDGGRDVIQTAKPESFWLNKKGAKIMERIPFGNEVFDDCMQIMGTYNNIK